MNFASRYLASLGYDKGWPLNDSANLPLVLSCREIAHLIVYDDSAALDSESLDDERRWILQEQAGMVSDCLADVCRRGLLKSTVPGFEHKSKRGWDYDGFLVHFDDARRYFAALDLVPPDGTKIATWLRGPCASSSSPTISSQDRDDFQQLCVEQWERNKTQTITGEGGVVAAVGSSYLRKYKKNTLEKWAREVAPDLVRGRRGRPCKSDGKEK